MAETPANITNRLTAGSDAGIQIEMPGTATKLYRKRIAEGLAEYFSQRYRDQT
jgi:hypothetical protein